LPEATIGPPTPATRRPNYLELLPDDPSLVPVVEGQPLRFVTMMMSFVDPQQFNSFENPVTGQVYMDGADELMQAIGRRFSRVEFIPDRPWECVRSNGDELP
jgi:hypothetical protein